MGTAFSLVLSRSTLLVFNLVDGLSGVILVAYGAYVFDAVDAKTGNQSLSWVYGSSMVLGTLLLLTSFFGICGLSFDSCRCSLCLSSWLAVPLATLELVIIIASAAIRPKILRFVQEHKTELGMSDQGLEAFKGFYHFILWFVVTLFLVALVRWHLSKHLREHITSQMMQMQQQLLDERRQDRRRSRLLENKVQRKTQSAYLSKYDKYKPQEAPYVEV